MNIKLLLLTSLITLSTLNVGATNQNKSTALALGAVTAGIGLISYLNHHYFKLHKIGSILRFLTSKVLPTKPFTVATVLNQLPQQYHEAVQLHFNQHFLKPPHYLHDRGKYYHVLRALASHFKYNYDYAYGFYFFNRRDLMGTTIETDLKTCINENSLTDAAKEELVRNYKIHLMPQQNNRSRYAVLIKFLESIEEDKGLRDLIAEFKVYHKPDHLESSRTGTIMPAIVIYPGAGQETAQKLLQKLYDIFKNVKGSGQSPRYNIPVTSLIYYAQGDGDHKYEFSEYFDYSEMLALYKSDFTGIPRDYHLNIVR